MWPVYTVSRGNVMRQKKATGCRGRGSGLSVPPISATALLWTFEPVACSLWGSVPSSLICLILSLEDPRRGCKLYRVYSKCGLYDFMNYDSQVPVIWWSQHLISINIWRLPNLHIYQTYSQMWRGCRTSICLLNLSRATPKSLVNLHVANRSKQMNGSALRGTVVW